MIKLLIVDDEPLIQVGIQSMLPWETHHIEICGTARNGLEALDLIDQYHPEIVITDIKMPIMDGLELTKLCKERYGTFPLFLILTSHEDFRLIKEAIHYDIIDYLVKLELTPSLLLDSINKAKKIIQEKKQTAQSTPMAPHSFFYDKFFISLLHNLFESLQHFEEESTYLKLEFNAPYYVVTQGRILSATPSLTLYHSSLNMLEELMQQYLPCHVVSLDSHSFCIIFSLKETELPRYVPLINKALKMVFEMVHKYFNVHFSASCGRPAQSPLNIWESYQDARQCHGQTSIHTPIVFFEHSKDSYPPSLTAIFNISLFKEDLRKAFEEYDHAAFDATLSSIIMLFEEHPHKYLQAIDAACNILYLSLSSLPNGEEILNELFATYPDGYRSIYKQTSMPQVLAWLKHFKSGLSQSLASHQKGQTHKLVTEVKHYIDQHITEKLSLVEVASSFHITPNYLSLLFKKHSESGFSEYISQQKIHYAKTLLDQGDLKVYEIAEQLGFESAFYFSKVFKKIEGCSPRDYKHYQ